MKPVYQDIYGYPLGNCLQASIASVLEQRLEDVPNFMMADDRWSEALDEYLEIFGLYALRLNVSDDWKLGDWHPPGYYLIAGPSTRGSYWHCLVGYGGKAVHDPFPPGNCELEAQKEWTVFVDRMEDGKRV